MHNLGRWWFQAVRAILILGVLERYQSNFQKKHKKVFSALPLRLCAFACAFVFGSSVSAQDQPLIFSVMADIPYDSSEAVVLQEHVADHNKYSPSEFIVHLGDFRGSASNNCIETDYSSVADILTGLKVPGFMVPGDNEYNDCSDPAQGWAYWTQYFLNFENNFCGAPAEERQSVRPENFAFIRSGVLFIGLNLVGGTIHDQNEWNTRMQQDADWVGEQFQAKINQVRGAVIFAQAGPNFKRTLFFDQFRQHAATFGKPVLFMHGDGHTWIQDQPFPEPNILRVQVDDGGSTVQPVQVTVALDTTLSMFVFKQNPWPQNTPVYNMPPCVSAGADQLITLAQSATLAGAASDDGDPNPPATLTITWSKISGPGTVTFGNIHAPVTTAGFSSLGTYVLRLTANDSQLQNSAEVTIIVHDGSPLINSFSPNSGPPGTEIMITGGYFTGVTGVTFNGTPTSFIVDNATQLRALVPLGATTGKLGVSNASGTGLSAADFIAQYSLSVNTFGYGNVTINPSGGIYSPGAVITLTATPALGYQFSNWSGDLAGSSNPATITMDANKNITAVFLPNNSSNQITHEETRTGGASDTTFVETSTTVAAVSGHLYLAAISTRPKVSVSSVSGLGLNWTLVKTQCSGRNTTAVEIWKAQGAPTDNDIVKAIFAGKPNNAVIAASRYSGVDGVTPIGNVTSGNTNGVNGSCSGGADTSLYSFNLTTTTNGAVIYGAAAMRAKTHAPGAGYIERVEIQQGAISNTMASVAVEEKTVATAATATVNGTFNGKVDWALAALEIKPQMKLTTNVAGSGTIDANPPGGCYNSGTVVTVTAIPQSGTAGFQFSGWSGDLSGSTNPASLTMNGNKNVTATFTPLQFNLTVNTVGAGNVTVSPSGGTYNYGTVVTLTAAPETGYKFSGWSGAVSDTGEVVTLTMNEPQTVTAKFDVIPIPLAYEETKIGGASSLAMVTTFGSLAAANGNLYLAAISMRPKVSVSSVDGLGLNWTLVRAKCGGRNTTAIEVWMAQGTPAASGAVTATFAGTPSSAVIAVSRYSGAATTNPIGNLLAGNTNGVNASGACSGGVDINSYSFNLTTTTNGAIVYGAAAIKGQTHTPGAGYAERTELQQANGVNISGVAIEDKNLAFASTAAVNGSLNGASDWAIVALEIKPQFVTQFALAVNTSGSGAIALNPPDGIYDAGTVVTLTATPAAGFQFSGWSGALSGLTNPATLTMDANKTVTAIFIPSNSVIHEETRAGVAANSMNVKTSASLIGVSDHLYLAAISTRPKVSVSSVSGLGLNWKLVRAKCAGRNTTGIEVWMAIGEPSSDDTVKATFASAPITAVIAVSRYSGVNVAAPIGNSLAGNTKGVNASAGCSGGVDNSSYSFNIAATVNGAVIYGATALKARTHAPGAGYTERAEIQQPGGANTNGIAVQDKIITTAATVTINGSFSGAVDWAEIALEIKPESSLAKKGEAAEKEKSPATTPSTFQLYQNYPNPFNAQSVIEYSLPQETPVQLVIYNTVGQIVRRLVNETQSAGRHRARWDGTNDFGAKATSGVYFYQLEIGAQKLMRKLVLLQ